MSKTYYVVNSDNVCENIVLWDGSSGWQPPENCTMLLVESTSVKNWELTKDGYALVTSTGTGSLGFTWDGAFLTTCEPKPEEVEIPVEVKSIGVQTL
jgi:hypothetical protein